jgi:hypothetical protein
VKHTILDDEYDAAFIDTRKYPPSTPFLLRGLAAAIQDSVQDWRPRLSELVSLLKRLDDHVPIVSAGGAYGAGKQIMDAYPGPATLLFGAAINVIGRARDTELKESIRQAKERLAAAGIRSEPCIQAVVCAATERASFDKVSEMLRDEFGEGMRASGTYSEEQIAMLVPEIVDATHHTRHRAIVGRWTWAVGQADPDVRVIQSALATGNSFDTLFLEKPDGEQHFMYGSESLSPIVSAAKVGCAHAITKRLLPLRVK